MILERQLLAKRNRNRALTGFAWDVMAGEGIDVEGPGHRRALNQVRDELVDPRKLFVCVALGVLLTSPKAQRKELVGLRIGRKENHVHEAWLVFKNWENLVLNGFGELSRFSRLAFDGDDSTEHSISPFGNRQAEPTLDKFNGSITENLEVISSIWTRPAGRH
jgi:hypothetical protein